ncbi:unnamed protein product, partial [Rotaria socialis]
RRILFIVLHRDLADHDKDGCLTPDEFVIAMHCCDIARTGQPLPTHFPDEWLVKNTAPTETAAANHLSDAAAEAERKSILA